MGRYDWPHVGRREAGGDAPGARGRFISRIRTDFDPDGARAASTAAPARPPHPGGPFAPPTTRQHLWQFLGPVAVLRGQAIGDPRVTGRVNMLGVETIGGQRVYAATANGGVWYSRDGGATWTSLGGFAPTPSDNIARPAQRHTCGAIAVSFGVTEATDIVFVGTGEHTSDRSAQPPSCLGGIGILVADHPLTTVGPDPWTREAKNLLTRGVARIAIQPSPGTGVVAATTIGLLQRPVLGAPDNDWPRVAGKPFSSLHKKCADVLWTKGSGARPERLWVWVQDGEKAGLWVRAAGETDFTKIDTPGAGGRRAVLAPAEPPDQIFVFYDKGQSATPLLFRVACASAATPVATAVEAGVPNVLKTQGSYDIALAVHPANKDRVVLGGSTFDTTSPDLSALTGDAAVIVGDVGMTAGKLTFGLPSPGLPATMIGVGAHADVHDLVYSNGGARLWLACDGGVYRSDHPTSMVGFFPVVDGMSVVESNYLANHPTCEGYVVAGLQDNGIIGRRSTGVWKLEGPGDGGGVVFDPIRPSRYVRQIFNSLWSSSDGSASFPFSSEKAAFYSMPAAISQRRPAMPFDVGQIIVGTSRLWYTENFGKDWQTLPKGMPPPAGNTAQDDFGELITVCRWQSPDVAWILGEKTLKRYSRTPGSDFGGGPGTWAAETVITHGVKNKKDTTSADGPIRDAAIWTDVAVNLEPSPGPGQPPVQRGTKGAVYLATIGNEDDEAVDTLWWFDGTSKWYATGLRTDVNGLPAPVTAIACDPERPAEIWIGTTVGVWFGLRSLHDPDPPTWTWLRKLNGLPEAAVEDLAIFRDGGLRLLRAAIAARGVWELRLDLPDLTDLTYVRAHDDDLRYRARAVEMKRDQITPRSWHGSPDVRPRRAPLPRAAPTNLPWTQFTPAFMAEPEVLRRFQCALRSRMADPRVRPTGQWDLYFNEVLRDLSAPVRPGTAVLPNVVMIDKPFWDLSMKDPLDPSKDSVHSKAEAWGVGLPTEADLYDFTNGLTEGDVERTSCDMPPEKLKIEIVVHHRGLDPVEGANVRVTLLQWTKNAAKWDDTTTWFTGNVPWTAALNQVLNSADGKTSLPVGDGWAFVLGDTNAKPHRVTLDNQTIDSMHSGVASFEINLDALKTKKNVVVLLVAAIHVGTSDDIALTPTTLQDLALTSPNVAVRSIRVNPKP